MVAPRVATLREHRAKIIRHGRCCGVEYDLVERCALAEKLPKGIGLREKPKNAVREFWPIPVEPDLMCHGFFRLAVLSVRMTGQWSRTTHTRCIHDDSKSLDKGGCSFDLSARRGSRHSNDGIIGDPAFVGPQARDIGIATCAKTRPHGELQSPDGLAVAGYGTDQQRRNERARPGGT
jgi:hypothetical protein